MMLPWCILWDFLVSDILMAFKFLNSLILIGSHKNMECFKLKIILRPSQERGGWYM